jgi:regulator of sigma E protease
LSRGLPAEQAGLAADDRILSVNGGAVSSWDELSAKILESGGRPLVLAVDRRGEALSITVTPARQVNRSLFGEELGEVYRIGIERATETQVVPAWKAPGLAGRQVVIYSELIVMSLVKMVQGKISARELGGPITIARVAGERAQSGLKGLLEFMAFLGVNLGVLNLLPIPVLDGGHLFFFLAEAVIRRPVQVRYRELAQQIGLFLLVSLMLFAVYNDIYRWIQG